MDDKIAQFAADAARARIDLETRLEQFFAEQVDVFTQQTGCRITRLRSWVSYPAGDDGLQGKVSIRIQTDL